MKLPVEKNKNIIVLGDIMLDKFYYGKLEDTSKEDPLAKILKVENTSDNLGGAGNVAANIKSMLSTPFLIGVIGNDETGKRIKETCQQIGISIEGVFEDTSRTSTIKSRLYDGDQVVRFDEEITDSIPQEIQAQIIKYVEHLIKTSDIHGIILQDYNKGVLTKALLLKIIKLSTQASIPIYVDPKKDNFFEYKNVTLFKPNEREINWSLPGMTYGSATNHILQRLNAQYAVVTLAEKGIYIADNTSNILSPAKSDEIIDVCGAGDTVITILALTHLSKSNMKEMALVANLAASIVCQSKGVTPIKYGLLADLYTSLYQDKDMMDIT